MLQSFETTARPETGPARLEALRAEMAARQLDAFLVPRADAHQGEYVAERDARLAWLTGFTGSAGFAAVTAETAGVFVDGRYRVQVKQQVAAVFTPVDWPETSLGPWLAERLAQGALVGFDPWLHSCDEVDALEKRLGPKGIRLMAMPNLVDAIWTDQPPAPMGAVAPYPKALAGRSSTEKRRDLAAALRQEGMRAALLTLPDSIAWLFNIRGSDIPRTPVAHGFAVLHSDGRADLYGAPGKFDALADWLGPEVTLRDVTTLEAALASLEGPVRLHSGTCPEALRRALGKAAAPGAEPVMLPKARKTAAEITATTEAHLRDGAAVTRFLAWFDSADPSTLTEIDLVRKLEESRAATNQLRDLSFETICGSGPNGAVIHYRVTEESNRALAAGDLIVLDSGAQYEDGTTDITRTLTVGAPGPEERAAYTRVLRGMIAMSALRFPRGTTGQMIDAIARAPLWAAGQDYAHGTGHGVGVYLSVHEGPQRLSRISDVVLEPGMILSNEPGFYLEGRFGIRLENLITVAEAPTLPGQTVPDMLHFETLTWAPFDRRLIEIETLTSAERAWLDRYHADCCAHLAPRLEGAALDWLHEVTKPL